MKVKIIEYNGKKAGIVFLTREERDTAEVIRRIEEYKKELYEVVIFISGVNKMDKVLQELIDDNVYER